ncbi:MAG: hypothetical protein J4F48_08570, partial [Nitrospinae bacterium]|nr:hypothetical protein [Nitrospinota bacterium]
HALNDGSHSCSSPAVISFSPSSLKPLLQVMVSRVYVETIEFQRSRTRELARRRFLANEWLAPVEKRRTICEKSSAAYFAWFIQI